MRKIDSPIDTLLIGSTATKMWFPNFRRSKDFDIYTMDITFQEQLQRNLGDRLVIRRQDHRKFFCKVDNRYTIDIARHTDISYIPEVIDANKSGKVIGLFGLKLILAKPTTLLMIKDVHSCFRHNWLKHIRDYCFLRTMVQEPYSEAEQIAYRKGMTYFKQFYKDDQCQLGTIDLSEIKRVGINLSGLCQLVQRADLESRVRIQKYIVDYCGGRHAPDIL